MKRKIKVTITKIQCQRGQIYLDAIERGEENPLPSIEKIHSAGNLKQSFENQVIKTMAECRAHFARSDSLETDGISIRGAVIFSETISSI